MNNISTTANKTIFKLKTILYLIISEISRSLIKINYNNSIYIFKQNICIPIKTLLQLNYFLLIEYNL